MPNILNIAIYRDMYIYHTVTSSNLHIYPKLGMMKYVPIILYGIWLQVNSSIDLYKVHNTFSHSMGTQIKGISRNIYQIYSFFKLANNFLVFFVNMVRIYILLQARSVDAVSTIKDIYVGKLCIIEHIIMDFKLLGTL